MSRSIKLANNDYIDSTGVVYGRKTLGELFDNGIIPSHEYYLGSTIDLDNLSRTITKFYAFLNTNGSVSNAPDNRNVLLVNVFAWQETNADWCIQEAYTIDFSGVNKYVRGHYPGGWTAWQRIIQS